MSNRYTPDPANPNNYYALPERGLSKPTDAEVCILAAKLRERDGTAEKVKARLAELAADEKRADEELEEDPGDISEWGYSCLTGGRLTGFRDAVALLAPELLEEKGEDNARL